MSVLAEVAKRVLRTAERAFCVDHPFRAEQGTKPGRKHLPILKRGECSVETESVLHMQCLKANHELAPKHFSENLDGQEESLLRVDPLGVVRS
jgi:hypothetical protein